MLETPRLILRPVIPEDAPHLFLLHSDAEVMRFTGDKLAITMPETRLLITERMVPQFKLYQMGRFAVFLKDGTFLGWCGLKYFPESQDVDLGYRFLKKFWGQGHATESSRAVLAYGFESLKINRIIAKVMPGNVGSMKVIQKLGMTYRGYLKDPTDPSAFNLYDLTKLEYKKCADS